MPPAVWLPSDGDRLSPPGRGYLIFRTGVAITFPCCNPVYAAPTGTVAPEHLDKHYDEDTAEIKTEMNYITIIAGEQQTMLEKMAMIELPKGQAGDGSPGREGYGGGAGPMNTFFCVMPVAGRISGRGYVVGITNHREAHTRTPYVPSSGGLLLSVASLSVNTNAAPSSGRPGTRSSTRIRPP